MKPFAASEPARNGKCAAPCRGSAARPIAASVGKLSSRSRPSPRARTITACDFFSHRTASRNFFNSDLEIDLAVPDFPTAETNRQSDHVLAIGAHRGGGEFMRRRFRKAERRPSHRNAGGKAFDIDGKVHARQGFIEVVDVEKNIIFGRDEGAEIHQVAVAAGLNLARRSSAAIAGHAPSLPPRRDNSRKGSAAMISRRTSSSAGSRVAFCARRMALASRSIGPSRCAWAARGVFLRRSLALLRPVRRGWGAKGLHGKSSWDAPETRNSVDFFCAPRHHDGKPAKCKSGRQLFRKAVAVATAPGLSPCTQMLWIGVGRIFPLRVTDRRRRAWRRRDRGIFRRRAAPRLPAGEAIKSRRLRRRDRRKFPPPLSSPKPRPPWRGCESAGARRIRFSS